MVLRLTHTEVQNNGQGSLYLDEFITSFALTNEERHNGPKMKSSFVCRRRLARISTGTVTDVTELYMVTDRD
jgi:hypothetical protein